jgi:MFS family permease
MKHNRIAVSVFYFCMGLCFSTWLSRIPNIKDFLKLDPAILGTILFALPVGQFVALPFSGIFVTRFGSKRVLSVAILLYALGLVCLGLVTEPWQLALALFGFGVAGNLSNISVNTQGVRVEALYARPIMASFHGSWSVAGFVGALIGVVAVSLSVNPLVHFAFVALIVGITVFIYQRDLVLIPVSKVVVEERSRRWFETLSDGLLFKLGLVGFCSMATEGAMFDWSGVYFKDIVIAPAALVPLGYASFMFTMSAGRFIADRLIAKFGRKRLLQFSGILISSGMYTAVLFPNLVTATIGFLMVGFGVSAVVPTVYSVAGRSSVAPGIAIATVTSVSFIGFLIGPPLIGWIASVSSLRVSYAVIGCLGFGISLIVTRMRGLD